tara:strand:- start:177 stop:914 length:738 start_codon:yes stop_codon:yes gene_type:complete
MIPKIAIPSFERPDVLKNTLKVLKKNNINQEPYVFLENKNQLDKYKNIKGCNFVITNTKGIQQKRNFIYDYFEANQYVISIDDDFVGVDKKNNKKLFPFNKIDELIKIGYIEMRKNNTCLFGLNIVSNPFFMKNKIQFGNYLIAAGFYGFINQPNKLMHSVNPSGLCEDQETSLKVTKFFGGVIRFSGLTYSNPNYGNIEGGLQSLYNNIERKNKEKLGCKYLSKVYKDLCVIKPEGVGLKYKRI